MTKQTSMQAEIAELRADQGVSAIVHPSGSLEVLSQIEVNQLRDPKESRLADMFRRCCLAVLNSGRNIDDAHILLGEYEDFSVDILQQDRGIQLELKHAPSIAFVDGKMIKGIQEHLFSVLRDVLYIQHEIIENARFDLDDTDDITNAVFHILRHAGVLHAGVKPNVAVCWGGHAISDYEYEYTKDVGYEFGLRGIDVCTGCGPGAMKGPMKGATIGHAKQRLKSGRYIGITEPGIIAAESPNPIVNRLVIMPDIEKRLEAFVRLGHGIVVFPGGAGTTEELLYVLGILLHPDNQDVPLSLVLTGPADSKAYFDAFDAFIGATLGAEAQAKYDIVIDDPAEVARKMRAGFQAMEAYRRQTHDAFFYNWSLTIEHDFQQPFEPTHANMKQLSLSKDQAVHALAANLRRALSGIVAGNVKDQGLAEVAAHGPYQLSGDASIAEPLDQLLRLFVDQGRMKLNGQDYQPCYEIRSN